MIILQIIVLIQDMCHIRKAKVVLSDFSLGLKDVLVMDKLKFEEAHPGMKTNAGPMEDSYYCTKILHIYSCAMQF